MVIVRSTGRAHFIDVARGCAMLLVFESHFGGMYFLRAGAQSYAKVASYVALPSSPTFLLFSGMMLGMLYRERGKSFPRVRLKLIDRGLFLLLPADLVIRAAHYWVGRDMGPGTRWVFVTDAIGFSMLVAPWLLPWTSAAARLVLGGVLLSSSWWVYWAWSPSSASGDLFKAIFFGDLHQKGAIFALVPWFSGYLAATSLGEFLARWRSEDRPLARRFAVLGGALAAVSATLHVLHTGHGARVFDFLSAGQKYPPSPVFFLASASVGCFILSLTATLEKRRTFPALLEAVAVIGRSSLVVFVAQYFVYYVGFYLLRLPMSPLWPLYFIASVILNYAVARAWDRYLGSRFLTVGLSRLVAAASR